MAVEISIVRAGQMYRYYLRQPLVGDGHRFARTPLRQAQKEAGNPAGRWMGRGLTALGLTPGEEVTESQLRNLFGEWGRHPYADRIETDRLAKGDSPKTAFRAGALGRRVTVTGADFVFRPQPTIYLLWALGDDETRRVIEAAHEYAIERVLAWIEDEVAVIRYGKDGIHRDRPPGGLVAARFRHYEARSGMPLLHDHLLLSVKGQRLDGKWGSIHTEALHENTVAASALYNELVAAEVCEALGLATEPRTVTAGRWPVPVFCGHTLCCLTSCCGWGSQVSNEWRLFWAGDGGNPEGGRPVPGWEDLEERERALGLRERQPILVSPDGRVDPRLSECLRRSAFSAKAQGTQVTYAPLYRLFFTFLWQRGLDWYEASEDDVEDWEDWRRRGSGNPAPVVGGTWAKEQAALKLLYGIAAQRGLVPANPVTLASPSDVKSSDVKSSDVK
ncbi:MobF family relaxase [Streptomyces rimosus]|uniref:MobF family relaxase n=1 Tax=Streptomyces rimosus TaxID=1927 RepID=UPI00099F107B|nr:MobF family relaxase [Streptomyces rimosus]